MAVVSSSNHSDRAAGTFFILLRRFSSFPFCITTSLPLKCSGGSHVEPLTWSAHYIRYGRLMFLDAKLQYLKRGLAEIWLKVMMNCEKLAHESTFDGGRQPTSRNIRMWSKLAKDRCRRTNKIKLYSPHALIYKIRRGLVNFDCALCWSYCWRASNQPTNLPILLFSSVWPHLKADLHLTYSNVAFENATQTLTAWRGGWLR